MSTRLPPMWPGFKSRRRRCMWVGFVVEIDLFSLFPIEVPGELDPLSFHKLCVDMEVKKTKFERNSSLECYHMTCLGKTNIQAKEVYCQFLSVMENVNKRRRNYISLSGTSFLGIQLKERLRLKERKFTFAAISSLDLPSSFFP